MSAYAPSSRGYGGHSARGYRGDYAQRGEARGERAGSEGYGGRGGYYPGVRAYGGQYRSRSDSRGGDGPGGYYAAGPGQRGAGARYRSRSAPRHAGAGARGYGGSRGAAARRAGEADDSGADSREAAEPGEGRAAAGGKRGWAPRAAGQSPRGAQPAGAAARGAAGAAPAGGAGGGAPAAVPQGIPLNVSGCRNKTISDIIAGTYLPFSNNHGKVVYKKEEKSRGLDVLIYFWDDRDGPELCGWWFGPNVGGDQVWAYHPSRTAATPPASEWNVPHDGPIDYTLSVTANRRAVDDAARKQPRTGGGAPAAAAVPAAAARAAQRPAEAGAGRGGAQAQRSLGEAKERRGDAGARGRGKRGDSRSPSRERAQESKESGAPGKSLRPSTPSAGMNAYFADAYSKRLERHAKAEESKRLEAEHQQGKEDQEKQDWTPQSEQVGRDGAEEAKQAHALLRRGEERRRREEAFPSTLDPSGTGADLSRPCQEAGRETRTSRREELPRREEASRRDEPSRREEPSRRDEPPRREELARREEHPRREEPARREEAARRDEPNRREEPRREELSRREDLLARRKGITSDADPAGGRTTRHRSRSPPERANARGSERGMGGWPDRGAEHPTGRGSQDEPQRWQASNRARDEAGDDDRRKAAQHHHRQVAPSPHDDRRREDERRRREDEEDRRRRDEERRKQEEEDRRRREEERRKQEEEDRRRREEERRRQEAESTRRWEAERSKREEEKSRVEEERRKHEEAVQRRRDEKRKIEEAERQLLEEQRRKEREIERKEQEERKLEEDKRREELEKKRREEWRKHEETMKAKAEEDKKRTEEEAAKRRGEEAKVLRQQQATLSVLRLLQKLSNANPENFDTLKAELEQALKTELPETGSQQELLKAEADRVLEYAKQYVEQVREQQQKWEEMRLQQLQKMEEQERTARALVEELVQLVTLAEAASEFVHYTAAPLAGDHELENAKVLLIGREVEQAGKTAMAACSSCADFLVQRRPEIDEAEGIRAEVQNQVSALQTRIQAATQQATEALQRARESTERIAREVASAARADQQAALFKKYDEDGDGILNRQEIRRYSREEFGFDLPAENLDRICRQLFQDDRDGLEFSDLQVLKTAVGIAREEERSRVKRAARLEKERQDKEDAEKRQALVEEKLEMLATESAQLMSEMNDLESKIRGAEADAETLANEAGQLEVEDLKSKAASVDASAESVKSALIVVQKQIQGLTNEVAEMPELVDPMRQELTSLSSKADMQSLRLLKAQGTAANARQLAFHKAFAEYDALRLEVATKLRVCIEAKGGKVDDLFGAIAGDRSEVTLEDVSLFLERQQCEVEAEKLEALFPRPEEAGAPAPEAGAPEAGAPEAGAPSAGAPAAGAPEAGAPEAEAGAPAAPAAGAEGGEAGAAAGAPGRARGAPVSREDLARVLRIFYKVVKEIVLSDDLLIERSGQIRRMDVGEVMEVYQGPVLDPSVGVCRIHGRAMRDGVVGWVTVAGKQGVTFLLPGGNVFKVMKPTFLSEDMKDLEGERFLRMLHEGEILEVLDWTRTSRSALGVTRIKAKVLGDGSIGWATTVDNDGVVYLEAA